MSTGAPNETGTPIRMPSTALLCVDSADATRITATGYTNNDTSPSSIYINKQGPLMFGYMTRIALTEVNFNWATPNVNARNNTLTFRISSISGVVPLSGGLLDPTKIIGTYRVGLTEGFTLPNDIASSLQTALNALTISGMTGLSGFVVTHFEQEARFNVSINNGVTLAPRFISILPPGKAYTFDAVEPAALYSGIVEDDLTYMMGLTPPVETENFYTEEIESAFASCQYTPYVDIISSVLTKNQNVRDNDSNIRNGSAKLARLYLSHPGAINQFDVDEDGVISKCNIVGVRAFTMHREFQTPKVISWNTTENIDVVDLQVVDRLGYPIYIEKRIISKDGYLVVLGNTAAFQFTLQVTET